jgi:diguanylate cyclase (GGDEF)-like protein
MPAIKIVNGPERGKVLPLQAGAVSIGRDPDSEIVIADSSVSGRHAEIIAENGEYVLRDLGSTNGTTLNGVDIQEKTLRIGDEIRIGTTILLFDQEDDEEMEEVFGKDDFPLDRTVALPMAAQDVGFLQKEERDPRRIRAAHRKLSTLYEISQEITSVQDLDALYQRTLDLIMEAVRADRGAILVEDDEGNLVPEAVRGPGGAGDTRVGVSRSMARQALQEDKGILISDAAQDVRYDGNESVAVHKIRSAICVPLKTPSRALGVVSVHRTRPLSPFVEEDLEFLIVICNQAAVCIENARLFQDLSRTNRLLMSAKDEIVRWTRELEVKVEERTAELRAKTIQLERMSVTDGMTGLYNHQHFQMELAKEVKRMMRYRAAGQERTFTIAMLDLDDLKRINDTYGHLAGDRVLKEIARVLKTNLREVDLVARYGGDEFSILLPETDRTGAVGAVEKILKRIRSLDLTYGDLCADCTEEQEKELVERLGHPLDRSGRVSLTISVGIAAFGESSDPKDILAEADAALYRAKRGGKDRIETAG